MVIAAGGGGIPTMYEPGATRKLVGVECVIDKDLATELLARELRADLLVILTDADAVYVDWGKPSQKAIRRAGPDAISAFRSRPARLDRRSRRLAGSRARPAMTPRSERSPTSEKSWPGRPEPL